MFVDKVISLVLIMLSRLVITSLPKSKYLLIAWLQSTSAVILEPRRVKSAAVSTLSPSICHEVTEPDAMILVFWILSFKPTFSFSSFTFIKRRFTSSSISATRVMSSAYLRLLVFLPAILIPACPSILQIREKKKKTHKNETRKKKRSWEITSPGTQRKPTQRGEARDMVSWVTTHNSQSIEFFTFVSGTQRNKPSLKAGCANSQHTVHMGQAGVWFRKQWSDPTLSSIL